MGLYPGFGRSVVYLFSTDLHERRNRGGKGEKEKDGLLLGQLAGRN